MSALTESRGGCEPGRKRRGKWTAEGMVKGAARPCRPGWLPREYPERMPALKAGNVMAFLMSGSFGQ